MKRRDIWLVTAALLLSNAMVGLDGTIINTALPAIISDLHGIQLMGWVVAIFLLATAIMTPLWSKLGEHIGNKKAYMLATVCFGVGSLLQGLAPSMPFLIVMRAIAGIGCGGMNSLPYIIYADLFDDLNTRARILGLASASYSAAAIIGPLAGGWIVDTFSWHWVFYINVPIAILSAILIGVFFQHSRLPLQHKPVDFRGGLLLITGLSCLLVGCQLLDSATLAVVLILFVLAAILLLFMVRTEGTASDPIVPIRLFLNHQLMVDFVLFVLTWGGFIAMNVYLPMWSQGLLATTAIVGGATQVPNSLTNFLGAELSPVMNRKWQALPTLMFSFLFLIASFVIMLVASVHSAYTVLLVASALVGFSIGICFSLLQIKVQADADPQDVPVATSFSFLIRMLSQTFMTAIYGVILNQALSHGVAASHGRITMRMMNQLTDAGSAKHLPQTVLPQMRLILHQGLHHIMLLALLLIVAALLFAIIVWYREKRTQQIA